MQILLGSCLFLPGQKLISAEEPPAMAAYLAALGVGIFEDLGEVTKAWALDEAYKPKMADDQVQRCIERWRVAVDKA